MASAHKIQSSLWLLVLTLMISVRSQSVVALVDSRPDSAFTASSIYSSTYAPKEGSYSSSRGWYSQSCCNVPNEWLQVDLGRVVQIYSIGTKGSSPPLFGEDWTTSYQFYYSITQPDSSFSSMTAYNEGETLPGNVDSNNEHLNSLDAPVIARYIRYRPLGYSGNWIVLRVEAYGHDTLSPTAAPTANPSQSPSETPTISPTNDPTLSPTAATSSPTPSSLSPTAASSAPSQQPTLSPTTSTTNPPTAANDGDEQGNDQQVDEPVTTTDSVQDDGDQVKAEDFMLPLIVGSVATGFICAVCLCAVIACKYAKTGNKDERQLQAAMKVDRLQPQQKPIEVNVEVKKRTAGELVHNAPRGDVALCIADRNEANFAGPQHGNTREEGDVVEVDEELPVTEEGDTIAENAEVEMITEGVDLRQTARDDV